LQQGSAACRSCSSSGSRRRQRTLQFGGWFVVGWENHILRGSTAFVVELPRGGFPALWSAAWPGVVAVGGGYSRLLSF